MLSSSFLLCDARIFREYLEVAGVSFMLGYLFTSPMVKHKKVVRSGGVELDVGQNQRQAAKGLSGKVNPPLLNKKEWFFVGDIELKAK